MAEHLVASTRGRVRSLTRAEQAMWLWAHLRAGVPDALSLVLMPDHLHLMAPPGRRAKVRKVLSGFARVFGVRFEMLPPQGATSVAIAGRMIRYGFNNPHRAGLVEDPWEWPWSTLRDLAAAAHPRWTALEAVAAVLGRSCEDTLRGLTTTNEGQFAVPRAGPVQAAALDDVQSAVAAALRMPFARVPAVRLGRRLVVQVCAELGQPPSSEQVARHLGVSSRSVRSLRAKRHEAIEAALLCLRDPRLRARLPD